MALLFYSSNSWTKEERKPQVSNTSSTASFNAELPFGMNNPVTHTGEKTSNYLEDLGVRSVSDNDGRQFLEKGTEENIRYNFGEIDEKNKEYGVDLNLSAWFIINTASKFQFEDGRLIKSGGNEGKYIPDGPVSYTAYGNYLKTLINYMNSKVPGWKVKWWSIDNEHLSIYAKAFCDGEINEECGKQAAKAYADVVEYSYKIIKEIDPKAKIVFGGPSSGTSDEEYSFYYKEALKFLKEKRDDGYFDFFDYHNYNLFKEYKTNEEGSGVDFFRKMLADAGFPDKPIVIKEGATHSGMNKLAKNRVSEHQTEREQAEYLLKRFIYHVAKGVKLILWSTLRENEDDRETFAQNGLIYNGIPKEGKCDPKKELPCPDPGDGVKKLSYYSFKLLVEKLKGSDWDNIQTVIDGTDNIYLYKFSKQGKSVWLAWNDNDTKKEVTISGITSKQVKITEGIPRYETGKDVTDYNTAFNTEIRAVTNGNVNFTLTETPVFVEEK